MARKSNRAMVWGRVYSAPGGLSMPTATALRVDLTGLILGDEVEEATVTRLVMKLGCTGAAGYYLNVGSVLADESGNFVPSPASDEDADFSFWDVLWNTPLVDFGESSMTRYDIRSKRKLRERNRTMWLNFRNDSGSTIFLHYMVNALFQKA